MNQNRPTNVLTTPKTYRLLAPDGSTYESTEPGTLGGYSKGLIYGRLDCWSARKFLARGGTSSTASSSPTKPPPSPPAIVPADTA